MFYIEGRSGGCMREQDFWVISYFFNVLKKWLV